MDEVPGGQQQPDKTSETGSAITAEAPQAPPPQSVASAPEGEKSFFKPDSTSQPSDNERLSWSTSEFHEHEKTASWYLKLALATVIIAAAFYFLTRSLLTPVVIVISGLVIGILGQKKPSQREYDLSNQGIRIGHKLYLYDEFRLFIVTPSSALPEVTLVPAKRFQLPVSLRYTPELEDKVISKLSDYLPFEERRPDLVDSLMQRIKF